MAPRLRVAATQLGPTLTILGQATVFAALGLGVAATHSGGTPMSLDQTLVFAVLERPTYQSAGEQCAAVQDLRCSVE